MKVEKKTKKEKNLREKEVNNETKQEEDTRN